MTRPEESSRFASPLLYCFYGDDFTGSTDVLDALAGSGVRAVLFLQRPSPAWRQRFADCQAIGLAGDSRSRTPEEMDEQLPEIFAWMREQGAPVAHYKVCSTFDSAPQRGSIGRAMEIGRRFFCAPLLPIVVAAPHLGRYLVFGNLFASAADVIYRIDRHPTMRCHPATPITEADLRLHLAQQTGMRIALLDIAAMRGGAAEAHLQKLLDEGAEAVLLDGEDAATQATTGRLIWRRAVQQPLFAVGSSGLTASLAGQWRAERLATHDVVATDLPKPVDTLLVMSGSCSPVTEAQIRYVVQRGYAGLELQAWQDAATWQQRMLQAVEYLRAGRSVVMYSALGPLSSGEAMSGEVLGAAMGRLLRQILERSGIRRFVIAGGDTASHAVAQLQVQALTWAGALVPGAPLCRAHAEDELLDGVELVLKGGQMGAQEFFEQVRLGTTTRME